MPELRLTWSTLLAALFCASCAVGPDFHRPDPPASTRYASDETPATTQSAPELQGGSQTIKLGQRIRSNWWTAFRSPQLDALIAKAFAASPTIEAAQAALAAAQANAAAQRAAYFPTVTAGYSAARTKQGNAVPASTTATPATAGSDSIYNFHTAQLTVGYTPDVFGGTRRSVESLQALAELQRHQLEAAYVTLSSNVASAAIQEALLRRQLQMSQTIIASGEQSLSIVQRQWKAGAVSHLDVALQESALAQIRQQLPGLRKQLEQTRDLLRTLTGEVPSAEIPSFDLDAFELPAELPVALPSQLVEQRPDLKAAEAQLHSAAAQIGVARAARLPQFSIQGQAGGGAMNIADMFSPAGRFFSVLAGVTQPIFDAGALNQREKAARANYDVAAAQYRAAVLNAMQNVADALHAVQADSEALSAASENARSARTVLDLTQRQYGHGYLDRVALINAQQTERQATITLLQARAARLTDTVGLFQSVAGDWSATEVPTRSQP